jgi:hypothetical protein
MTCTLDLEQIRVVQANNYKGNPRIYLEIMDQRIFYADVHDMRRSENWSSYVTIDDFNNLVVDTESIADMFRAQLGHALAELLLKMRPELSEIFSTDTDRAIDYTKPRIEEI